jgi:hypothetical protein
MQKTMSRRLRTLLSALALIAVSHPASYARDAGWPAILPLKQSIYFTAPNRYVAGFHIYGVDEKPLYLIECDDRRHVTDRGFNYSGDFECRLTPEADDIEYNTLFTDDPDTKVDWSRARFLREELVGRCAEYPERGAVRQFRLRAMRITLALRDVVFSRADATPRLQSFRLEVEVTPDPAAKSKITEPVPYRYPPYVHPESKTDFTLNCSKVLRD